MKRLVVLLMPGLVAVVLSASAAAAWCSPSVDRQTTTLLVTPDSGRPGVSVEISGSGWRPGATVEFRWDRASDAVLGLARTDPGGTLGLIVVIPQNAGPGFHKIDAIDMGERGTPFVGGLERQPSMSVTFRVVAPAVSDSSSAIVSGGSNGTASGATNGPPASAPAATTGDATPVFPTPPAGPGTPTAQLVGPPRPPPVAGAGGSEQAGGSGIGVPRPSVGDVAIPNGADPSGGGGPGLAPDRGPVELVAGQQPDGAARLDPARPTAHPSDRSKAVLKLVVLGLLGTMALAGGFGLGELRRRRFRRRGNPLAG